MGFKQMYGKSNKILSSINQIDFVRLAGMLAGSFESSDLAQEKNLLLK